MREIYLLLVFMFIPALATRIPCRYDPSIQTLEALVKCFEQYTIPEGYYTSENAKHCSAQPVDGQLWAWKVLVAELWGVDLAKANRYDACKEMQYRSPSLVNIYESWIFKEDWKEFCVLSEMHTDPTDPNVYSRGWGLLVVPLAQKWTTHVLHLSVPRPLPGMAEYAATAFKSSIGRSLLINGRHPRAIRHSSSCVQPTDRCQVFHKTDAVYDKDEPFSQAASTIVEWENSPPELGGTKCPRSSCAHVSLLPMSDAECGDVNILVSDGFGLLSFADGWYSTPTNAVRRIMNRIYGSRAAHPSTSLPMNCGSSAPINVLGRVVNGGGTEDPMSVCSGYASWLNIRGNFIHIELDNDGRKSDVAPIIGAALKAAYTPT